jgi:hypothetical protein
MAPLPAAAGLLSKAASGLATLGIGAGALTILNGVVGNAFNPVLTNPYTANVLARFPSDLPLIDGQLFCILFQFYKYNRPSILVPPTLTALGGIALPLPADMIDQSAMNYSEEQGATAVNAALENFSGVSTTGGSVSAVIQQVGEAAAGIGNSAQAAASQAGINALSNIAGLSGDPKAAGKLLQFAGVAQNPFLSIMFNAPTFKRHVFAWTFIPETSQDTEFLNFILNKFRYHSMPDIAPSTGGILLTYPDMCVPVITPAGYMYDFKQCVIESMSINYAPGDTPSFNTKNAPSAVKLTIKLLEIEYWVKSDLLSGTSDFVANTIPNSIFGQAPYGSAA